MTREQTREEAKAKHRIYIKAYRKAHPEKLRAAAMTAKAYYAIHRDQKLAYSKAYNVAHREKLNAAKRAHYAAHREQRRTLGRAYQALHRKEQRNRDLKKEYGITLQEFNNLLIKQCGQCALCRKPIFGRECCMDHDHNTNRIREILCSECNRGLGAFRDSSTLLRLAAEYIEKWEKRHDEQRAK